MELTKPDNLKFSLNSHVLMKQLPLAEKELCEKALQNQMKLYLSQCKNSSSVAFAKLESQFLSYNVFNN